MRTTWRAELVEALESRGEAWADIESSTLSEQQLDREFESRYGERTSGAPFTVWTAKRVYFPICYDGSEWVGSVSRNPDGCATEHQGGGG